MNQMTLYVFGGLVADGDPNQSNHHNFTDRFQILFRMHALDNPNQEQCDDTGPNHRLFDPRFVIKRQKHKGHQWNASNQDKRDKGSQPRHKWSHFGF